MKKIIGLILLTFLFVSCGDGVNIKIDGVDGPKFDKKGDHGIMSLWFRDITVTGEPAHFVIPYLPQSYVELSSVETGGSNFVLAINVDDIKVIWDDIIHGQTRLDKKSLPGGRPLPGVPTGAVPAVAFTIKQFYNVTVYLGTDVIGFFVPFWMNIGNNIVTFRYFITKERAGNLSLVGPDNNNENSGILLLFDINTKPIQEWLKKILHLPLP